MTHIEKQFGKVSEYVLFPYRNILEKQRQEISYAIPDFVNLEGSKKNEKLKKEVTRKPISSQSEQEKQTAKEKNPSDKILNNIQKEK